MDLASASTFAYIPPAGSAQNITPETPPTVQAQSSIGSYDEQWLTEIYTPANLSEVPDGTLVTALFKDSASGATLNLTPYDGSNEDTEDEYWHTYNIYTFADV